MKDVLEFQMTILAPGTPSNRLAALHMHPAPARKKPYWIRMTNRLTEPHELGMNNKEKQGWESLEEKLTPQVPRNLSPLTAVRAAE